MMTFFRKKAGIITIFTAVAFIVGMGLVGVGDIFQKKSRYVGKIGKKKISIQEYISMLQTETSLFVKQSPETNIDEDFMRYINNSLWNRLVQEHIIKLGLKDYKIKIDDQEIIERMKNDPPNEVKTSEDFLTDGVYDHQKYTDALQSGRINLEALEIYYRNIIPLEKLEKEIMKGVFVQDGDARQRFIEENEMLDVKIIWFNVNNIVLQNKTTEKEIDDYYNLNKEIEFKKGATRKVQYVRFDILPSEEDKELIHKEIQKIYNEIITNKEKEFSYFVKKYSSDNTNNGDLGYVGKGILLPEFDKVAFTLVEGEVSTPFLTERGWHIIKAVEIKDENKEKKVRLSHLYKNITASQETRKKIEIIAENFVKRAKVIGLGNAAEEFDLKIDTSAHIGKSSANFPNVGKDKNLTDFVFSANIGDISDPIFSNQSYNVFMISDINDDQYLTLKETKEYIKTQIETEKKKTLLPKKVDEFLKSTQDYLDLAEDLGWDILEAKKLTINQPIPKIGSNSELSEIIFGLEQGEYSSPYTNEIGTFVSYVEKRYPINWEEFDAKKEDLKTQIYDEKKIEQLNMWFQGIIQKVGIIDQRKEYFNYL